MILVIDNYDSFTYNLVQYVGQLGMAVEVRRNDQVSVEEIKAMLPLGILLSPGPCTPTSSGVCLSILAGAFGREPDPFLQETPIFGVCLGAQSMGYSSGATVRRARNVMHGKTSPVEHDGKGLFEGMPSPFTAVRYHSLVIERETIPPEFEVTATSVDDGEVMGLRHRTLPIEGVQFHPESVLTENGIRIVENFVNMVRAKSS